MKRIATVAGLTVAIYVCSWVLAYVGLLGFDFSNFSQYLKLAWTDPGEIPSYLRFLSLSLTIVSLLVYFLVGYALRIFRRVPADTTTDKTAT